MLVLLVVASWFILRGDLLYVLPCVILFLYFSVLLALRLPRLGKRELILVLCSICACLDLSVSSSSWCLGRAVVCDCGTPGLFSYPFSICACLDLSVSSSSWGLRRAAVCDCGTPWSFLLPFFLSNANKSGLQWNMESSLYHPILYSKF